MDTEQKEAGAATASSNQPREPYVTPVVETTEGKLLAMLDSACDTVSTP